MENTPLNVMVYSAMKKSGSTHKSSSQRRNLPKFKPMSMKLPVKNLIKLNLIISFTSAILVFIYLITLNNPVITVAPRFFQVLFLMLLNTFSNLFFYELFFQELSGKKPQLKLRFYICSYITAYMAWLLVLGLYSWITGEPWEGLRDPDKAIYLTMLSMTILNTLVIVLQSSTILQHRKANSEIENLQLKASASEVSNLLLRQQIHPHFLFNSLNTIKSLYKKDILQGEEYLVHLANFLRVSLSNQHTKTTLVINEVDFCLDYLKMQSIRFDKALNYKIDISPSVASKMYLPFFSLQPLVENVIKHNDLTEQRPIYIQIAENDGYITVSNNIQPKSFKELSTGIGLANLSERYRLLGEENIKISSEEKTFKVRIKLLEQ